MSVRHLLLGSYLLALGAIAGAQAEVPADSPRKLIADFGAATLPEAKENNADDDRRARLRALEAQTADKLRAFVNARPGDAELTRTDIRGRTPLMEAAANGYDLIVEALLENASVRADIGRRDRFGADAWALSQFARPLALWACHPYWLKDENAALWAPYWLRMGYFVRGPQTPFERIGEALVTAGTRPDPPAAKQAWLALCPGHDDATAQRIEASSSLLDLLIKDTGERLDVYNRGTSRQATPPEPPVLVAHLPEELKSRSSSPELAGFRFTCRQPLRPPIPASVPSGKYLLKATVEVQAGMPVVADIRAMHAGQGQEGALLALRRAILIGIAGSRCDGDHVYSQEFEFNID